MKVKKISRSYSSRPVAPASKDQSIIKTQETASTSLSEKDQNDRFFFANITSKKLRQMKEDYKHLYEKEKEFDDAWKKLKSNLKHPLEYILKVFSCHNLVVDALINFDNDFHTAHMAALGLLLENHKLNLKKLGVSLTEQNRLYANKEKMAKGLNENPNFLDFLVKPQGFLHTLCRFYQSLEYEPPTEIFEEDSVSKPQGFFFDGKI